MREQWQSRKMREHEHYEKPDYLLVTIVLWDTWSREWTDEMAYDQLQQH